MPLGFSIICSTVTFDLFFRWATQGPLGPLVKCRHQPDLNFVLTMFLYWGKHSGGDISDQENNKLHHFNNTNKYADLTLFHYCYKSVSLIIIQGNSQEAMTLAMAIIDKFIHPIKTEAPHWKASLPTCDFEQMMEEARRWLTHLGVDDRGIGNLIYILYFTTLLCPLNLQQHLPFKWQEPYKRPYIYL